MISNQILQNTIDGVKGITKIDLSVVDADGNVLAETAGDSEDYLSLIHIYIRQFHVNVINQTLLCNFSIRHIDTDNLISVKMCIRDRLYAITFLSL